MKITLLSILFFAFTIAKAQSDNSNKATLGFGIGQDYGGIGVRAEYLVYKHVGLFFGGGYNLLDVAFNTGISYKAMPDKKIQPVIALMYGYNGVIKVKNVSAYSKTYYGFTAGAGVQMENKNNSKWLLQCLVPIGRTAFNDDYNRLKNIVEFERKPLPITFSVGYLIDLKRGGK